MKARRPRPAVKLELEGLMERILPSASTVALPPVAAVTPQMVATMDQWSHLIATVQQDLNSVWKTIVQDITQEVAYVEQQWDHLLGINPNASNPSLGTAVPQPGSGGATPSAPEAASSPPSSPNRPPAIHTGPLVAQPDQYIWDPSDGTDDASHPQNWLLNGQRPTTVPGNQATDAPLFDPGAVPDTHGNDPIIWDQNFKFSTMTLGGKQAYTGLQTINSGVTVELTGANGSGSLNMPVTSSDLHPSFTDATSKFQIDANATITNMHLGSANQAAQAAQFLINGGTTTVAANPGGYEDLIGVSFVIGPNATLNDQSYNALKFWASSLNINVQGTMQTFYGSGGYNLIDINGNSSDYIWVNGGTLKYNGNGGVTDTFTAPVLVQSSGTFRLTAAAGAANGGKLIVQGIVPGQTNNASVFMKNVGSSVQLAYGDTLECDSDYYQADGALETTDTTLCTLQDGQTSGGTATIAGGFLLIGYDANAGNYGVFNVNAAQLNFNGTYQPAIAGNTGSPGVANVLSLKNTNGKMNLQGSSSLVVTVSGQLQHDETWGIINAGNILNDFNTKTPQTNWTYSPNTPAQGGYLVQYTGN